MKNNFQDRRFSTPKAEEDSYGMRQRDVAPLQVITKEINVKLAGKTD